jgi:hypothetical protein
VATTTTYGGRHAYGANLQAQVDAEKAARAQRAQAQEVSSSVVVDMFGSDVPDEMPSSEIDLGEVDALLTEADALLEDLEDSTAD